MFFSQTNIQTSFWGVSEMFSLMVKFYQEFRDAMLDVSYFSNKVDKEERFLIFENGCVLGKGSDMVSLSLGWVKFRQELKSY